MKLWIFPFHNNYKCHHDIYINVNQLPFQKKKTLLVLLLKLKVRKLIHTEQKQNKLSMFTVNIISDFLHTVKPIQTKLLPKWRYLTTNQVFESKIYLYHQGKIDNNIFEVKWFAKHDTYHTQTIQKERFPA